jgi:hypothetical protein
MCFPILKAQAFVLAMKVLFCKSRTQQSTSFLQPSPLKRKEKLLAASSGVEEFRDTVS